MKKIHHHHLRLVSLLVLKIKLLDEGRIVREHMTQRKTHQYSISSKYIKNIKIQ